MKKRIKKVLAVIGIILLLFIILVGYLVYKDLKQEDVLKKEVINLSNKDLLEDNFNIDIKTTGDYAYVENAIKKYYKELSDNVKKLNYALDNEELLNILSTDTLQSDRPSFTNSRNTIKNVKKTSTESLQKIATLCDEEYIKNLLDKEKVSDYYIDFYKKIMYTEKDIKTLIKTKEEMEEISNSLNEFLDKVEEILSMLERNNSAWYIEDKQIYFETEEQVNEYNKLYEELKGIANDKLGSKKYVKSIDEDISI